MTGDLYVVSQKYPAGQRVQFVDPEKEYHPL
jgi:hypothetical protein